MSEAFVCWVRGRPSSSRLEAPVDAAGGPPAHKPAAGFAHIQRDLAEAEGKSGTLRRFMQDLREGRRSIGLETTGASLLSSAVQEVEPLLEVADAIPPAMVDASLVLPAGDGVLGLAELIGAAAGKVTAWRRASATETKYRCALATLAQYRLPAEAARRKETLKATRHWICACIANARQVRAGQAGASAPCIGAHRLLQDRAPQHSDGAGWRNLAADQAGAAALGHAAIGVIDRELAAIDQVRDNIIRHHCADVIAHQAASRDDRRATRRLLGSSVACLRDNGLQGLRIGYEASPLADGLLDLPFDLGMVSGDLASLGFSGVMGLAHAGSGVAELAEARRRRTVLDGVQQAVGENLTRLAADPARRDRLRSRFATEALGWFKASQRGWRQRASQLARWAWCRIAYGVTSFLLSSAGVGATAMLGATAIGATGGTALVVIGVVLGTAWLLFSLAKIVIRFRQASADQRAARLLARTIRRCAARGLNAGTLAQCTLAQLEALPRYCPALTENRHWQAAIVTRRLLIDERAGKTASKPSRLEASTMLQAIGMPRTLTTMLKRADFELAYPVIQAYLHGDVAQSAWSDGVFHRVGAPHTPGEGAGPQVA